MEKVNSGDRNISFFDFSSIFLNMLNKTLNDKTECRPSAPKRTLFHEWLKPSGRTNVPHDVKKTGRTTILHSFLRAKKLSCLYQLSSLAFSRFLPLFEISADNNAEGTEGT